MIGTIRMARALFGKELVELAPFAVLQVALFLVSRLFDLWEGERGDGLALWLRSATENHWVTCLLALALGVGVSRREQQDGTLHFLDGLPLSRSAVFWTKIAAVTLVVTVGPTLDLLAALVYQRLEADSLQPDLHLTLVGTALVLQWVVSFVCVCVGAAAGLMRSLAWPALALASGLLYSVEEEAPVLGALRPTALLVPHLVGVRWELSAQVVAAQVALVGGSLAIAWFGFLRSSRSQGRELRPWISAGLQVLGGLVMLVAFVVAVMRFDEDDDSPAMEQLEGERSVEVAARYAAALETRWFRFSYRAERAQEVRALAEEADGIAEQVAAIVGLPIGEQVEVDTSGSMDNTSGTAFADSVRMEMGSGARSTLAHELTHVITHRAVGDEGARRWGEATLLNEGLAEWVERRFSGDTRPDRALAVLAARRELDVGALMDMEAFARSHDQNLKYPIGAALVEALVQLGGPEAPARVVAAFALPELPADLKGRDLYATVFQLAGVDLGRAIDEVNRTAPAAAPAAWVAALPRPEVTLFVRGFQYWLQVTSLVPLPEDCSLRMRTRPTADAPLKLYRSFNASGSSPQWREMTELRDEQVCFQAGVQLPRGEVLYEPWTCVPISAAAAWVETGGDDGM